MNIGDVLTMRPSIYGQMGFEAIQPRPCTVTYIHPTGRFFVVRFRSTETGESWQEAFHTPVQADPSMRGHASRGPQFGRKRPTK